MHRADVVVIGPIDPVLPRALRMPIPVAFGGAVGVLAVLVAAVVVTLRPVVAGVLPFAVSGATGASDLAPLVVVSQPAGAEVFVDNQESGHTPATVDVARGRGARCRVLHGTCHECDDAYRNRDIANVGREVVEQRVDASVHRTSDVTWRAALSTSLRRQRVKGAIDQRHGQSLDRASRDRHRERAATVPVSVLERSGSGRAAFWPG